MTNAERIEKKNRFFCVFVEISAAMIKENRIQVKITTSGIINWIAGIAFSPNLKLFHHQQDCYTGQPVLFV